MAEASTESLLTAWRGAAEPNFARQGLLLLSRYLKQIQGTARYLGSGSSLRWILAAEKTWDMSSTVASSQKVLKLIPESGFTEIWTSRLFIEVTLQLLWHFGQQLLFLAKERGGNKKQIHKTNQKIKLPYGTLGECLDNIQAWKCVEYDLKNWWNMRCNNCHLELCSGGSGRSHCHRITHGFESPMGSCIQDLQFIKTWVVPPPSNSHHQDYYMFSRGSL